MNPLLIFAALGALAWWLYEQGQTSPQPTGDGTTPGPSPEDAGGAPATLATNAGNDTNGAASGPAGGAGSSLSTEGGQVSQGPETGQGGAFQSAYASSEWHDLIQSTESDLSIPTDLLARVLYQESHFNAGALGPVNANGSQDYGIAQINLAAHPEVSKTEAFEPSFAIPWAGEFLVSLYDKKGNWFDAVTAYNGSGPAAVAYADAVIADVPAAQGV